MILPTINLVARPNMVLPSDTWAFSRSGDAFSINPTGRLAKYTQNQIRQDYGIGSEYGTYNGMLIEGDTINLVNSTRRTVYAWTQSPTGYATQSSADEGIVDPDDTTVSGQNKCTVVTIPTSGTLTLTTGSSQFSSATASGPGKYTMSAYVRVMTPGRNVTVKLGLNTSVGADKTVTYATTAQWFRIYSGFSFPSAVPTSAKIIISGTSGTIVRVDMVQVEFGNLTSITSATGGARSLERLTTVNTLGQRINEKEGTLFLMYKHSDNDLNVINSIYPLMSIGDAGNAYGLWVYVVTSNSESSTTNAIMVRSKAYPYSTQSLFVKTRTSAAATAWTKLAVTYGVGVIPSLAINGTVLSTNLNLTGQITSTTTTPVIRVGHESLGAGTSWSVSDSPTPGGNTYSISTPATSSKTYCLDGNIMHFAYFPRELASTDLAAITD